MSRRTGEREPADFEMVLGNKQLLSVLLLVVILLGIFFAMGYLAGQSGAAAATSAAAPKAVERPPATPPRPAPSEPPPGEKEDSTPKTQAAATSPALPASGSEEAEAPARHIVPNPPDGKYLQAAALPRPQAEAMLNLINKDGQSAHLALSPTRTPDALELYRVLLGPLEDNAQMAAARAYLKNKGVDKPIPRTYPDAPAH